MQFAGFLLRLLIGVLFTFTLSACLPGAFKISVDDSQTGKIKFTVHHISGSCGEKNGSVPIQSIWVGKPGIDGTGKTFWSLRSIEASGVLIHSLEYGVVPSGFREEEKSQPLISGDRYEIGMAGHACSGGQGFTMR